MANKIYEFEKLNDLKLYVKNQKQQLDYFDRHDYRTYHYGFVYLIIFDNKCKIGITMNPYDRIKDITSNAKTHGIQFKKVYLSKLCTNAKIIEKQILSKYENKRYNEWFDFNVEQLKDLINYMDNADYNLEFISKEQYLLQKERSTIKAVNLINEVKGKPKVNNTNIWTDIILDSKYDFDIFTVENEIYNKLEKIEKELFKDNSIEKKIINVFLMDNLHTLRNQLFNIKYPKKLAN